MDASGNGVVSDASSQLNWIEIRARAGEARLARISMMVVAVQVKAAYRLLNRLRLDVVIYLS